MGNPGGRSGLTPQRIFRTTRWAEAVRESVLEKGQVLEMRLGEGGTPTFKGSQRKPATGARKWPVTQEESQGHHTMVSREMTVSRLFSMWHA